MRSDISFEAKMTLKKLNDTLAKLKHYPLAHI